MRVLFVNENIGGHATVHHHLANALLERGDVEAEFLTVPPPRGLRRLAGAAVPGLGALDLDLQPLRAQLALGAWVRARLAPRAARVDAVHIYTHNAGLLATHVLARVPTVVSLDTTNANNAYRLPYRMPTRFTPATVALTKPFERRVYDAAVTVVANSEWAARSLRDDYGVADAKIRVFPFGIAAPAFPTPEAPGTAVTELPTLVFVGNQLRRKGGEMLRAAAPARAGRPLPARPRDPRAGGGGPQPDRDRRHPTRRRPVVGGAAERGRRSCSRPPSTRPPTPCSRRWPRACPSWRWTPAR